MGRDRVQQASRFSPLKPAAHPHPLPFPASLCVTRDFRRPLTRRRTPRLVADGSQTALSPPPPPGSPPPSPTPTARQGGSLLGTPHGRDTPCLTILNSNEASFRLAHSPLPSSHDHPPPHASSRAHPGAPTHPPRSPQVPLDNRGRPRGFGVVELATPDAAAAALRSLAGGVELRGSRVLVRDDTALALAAGSNSVFVSNLPATVAWPALKEHLRLSEGTVQVGGGGGRWGEGAELFVAHTHTGASRGEQRRWQMQVATGPVLPTVSPQRHAPSGIGHGTKAGSAAVRRPTPPPTPYSLPPPYSAGARRLVWQGDGIWDCPRDRFCRGRGDGSQIPQQHAGGKAALPAPRLRHDRASGQPLRHPQRWTASASGTHTLLCWRTCCPPPLGGRRCEGAVNGPQSKGASFAIARRRWAFGLMSRRSLSFLAHSALLLWLSAFRLLSALSPPLSHPLTHSVFFSRLVPSQAGPPRLGRPVRLLQHQLAPHRPGMHCRSRRDGRTLNPRPCCRRRLPRFLQPPSLAVCPA